MNNRMSDENRLAMDKYLNRALDLADRMRAALTETDWDSDDIPFLLTTACGFIIGDTAFIPDMAKDKRFAHEIRTNIVGEFKNAYDSAFESAESITTTGRASTATEGRIHDKR